ncbi:MAG: multidrug ABC transporter [Lachnospiraceae bacterium]|nr:multidrug ABC transporter [Lachnospiraceae bacterium]
MSSLLLHSLIYIGSVFVASVSQILLKKSAQKEYKSPIFEYLNPLVIIAYGMFFVSMLITMVALRVVPLSLGNLLEGVGYIYVPILGYFFLGEKMSVNKLIGSAFIIGGIAVYALF